MKILEQYNVSTKRWSDLQLSDIQLKNKKKVLQQAQEIACILVNDAYVKLMIKMKNSSLCWKEYWICYTCPEANYHISTINKTPFHQAKQDLWILFSQNTFKKVLN